MSKAGQYATASVASSAMALAISGRPDLEPFMPLCAFIVFMATVDCALGLYYLVRGE